MERLLVVEVQRQSTPTTKTLVSCGSCGCFPAIGSTIGVYNRLTNKMGEATVTSLTPESSRVLGVYTMADGDYDSWTS